MDNTKKKVALSLSVLWHYIKNSALIVKSKSDHTQFDVRPQMQYETLRKGKLR